VKTKILSEPVSRDIPWPDNSGVQGDLGRGRVKTLIVVVAEVASVIMGQQMNSAFIFAELDTADPPDD
jgi:hypothetical protein